MSYILKLECINEMPGSRMDDQSYYLMMFLCRGNTRDIFGPKRYWVAEIAGIDAKYGYKRKFVSCKKDYAKSNMAGTRGIYAYYILEDSKVYEVSSPQSWRKTDRYFCTVVGNELIKLSRKEVDEWLNNTLT